MGCIWLVELWDVHSGSRASLKAILCETQQSVCAAANFNPPLLLRTACYVWHGQRH